MAISPRSKLAQIVALEAMIAAPPRPREHVPVFSNEPGIDYTGPATVWIQWPDRGWELLDIERTLPRAELRTALIRQGSGYQVWIGENPPAPAPAPARSARRRTLTPVATFTPLS